MVLNRVLVDGRYFETPMPDQKRQEIRGQMLESWSRRRAAMLFLTARDPTLETRNGEPVAIWTTSDERERTIKPFPNWQYVDVLFRLIDECEGVLGIEKARQVFATTSILGKSFHECAVDPVRIVLSKSTRDEASELLDVKIRQPYSRMPGWVRAAFPASDKPKDRIRFPGTNSVIQAVAQNAAVRAIRGISATRVIIDEAAFQGQLSAMFRAAMPMSASVIALTSADGNELGGQTFVEMFDLDSREQHAPLHLPSADLEDDGSSVNVPSGWPFQLDL